MTDAPLQTGLREASPDTPVPSWRLSPQLTRYRGPKTACLKPEGGLHQWALGPVDLEGEPGGSEFDKPELEVASVTVGTVGPRRFLRLEVGTFHACLDECESRLPPVCASCTRASSSMRSAERLQASRSVRPPTSNSFGLASLQPMAACMMGCKSASVVSSGTMSRRQILGATLEAQFNPDDRDGPRAASPPDRSAPEG